MGVGELANMLGSTSYMLPTVLLYRRLKTRNGAILSLSTGMIITCICATLSNLYLVFPIYCKLYGMSMDNLVAMGTAVNPLVRDMRTFVVFSMLPGNLIKYFLISIVTFIAYKRINKINIWMEERV